MLPTLELYLLYLNFYITSKLPFTRNRRDRSFIVAVLCVYFENEVCKSNSTKWILFLEASATENDKNNVFLYVLHIIIYKFNVSL